MDINKMPIKLFVKKLSSTTDSQKDAIVEHQVARNPRFTEEYRFIEQIWQEAGKTGIFDQIDTESGWNRVREKIGLTLPMKYNRLSWPRYFLRIAALVILTSGLSVGLYKIITRVDRGETGMIMLSAEQQVKDLLLPDGSTVSLNAGSRLTYRDDFGTVSRDVILEGEGLFTVVPDRSRPFKVFVNESVVEVTGTKFSVREENGSVMVSVLSGTVVLSTKHESDRKINIAANHSGYLRTISSEIVVEEGVPVNILSWKTGHLVFEETPIDSALFDIARHFRKELSLETAIKEEITAEFQDQPLHEILQELELVAGLHFDTTRTTLIVRK
jgi:ferric-dicitrate binding protein FerR (iron transport regulator)